MNANIGFTSTKTYLVTLAFNLLSSQFLDCLHDNGTGPDLSHSSVYFTF